MSSDNHSASNRRVAPEELIDIDFYGDQASTVFSNRLDALTHYRKQGQSLGLDPSPFFYTKWFVWQNPSCTSYRSALDFFVAHSANRSIDPTPFISGTEILGRNAHYCSVPEALRALTQRLDESVSPNLSDHLTQLRETQTRVQGNIRSSLLRDIGGQRRRLVWIQAGSAFRVSKWFRPDVGRSWDLMCNWYALDHLDLRFGEIHLRQSGTKATAIHHVLGKYPEIIFRYDQVLFLDDDLEVAHEDLDLVFELSEEFELDLFQPALSRSSQGVWPDLFRKGRAAIRRTSGVEIMMPGFSKRALQLCAPTFRESVSGFGLDFLFSEVVLRKGWRCGVVNAVEVNHLDTIDEMGGSFYRFLRALGINQKLELYKSILDLGSYPRFNDL
jgi:hypothetical protein